MPATKIIFDASREQVMGTFESRFTIHDGICFTILLAKI
jgi:hypothetical protein